MPAVDDKLANAAMRVMTRDRKSAEDARRVAELDLEARVDALIKAHDAPGIFALMPQFALQQDVTAAHVIRQKIKQEFRGVLNMKDFDKALQAERKKLRAKVRSGNLPNIKCNDRPLREIVHDSLEALRAANDPPQLFARSGEIVYVAQDERGRPAIITASQAHLRGRLDRAANYIVESPIGQIQRFPPDDAVKDILALSNEAWGFPPLVAVVETPTLRSDGTILDTPGYDAESGLYYQPAPGFEMLPVPDQPTTDDVEAALDMLDEAIGEFPFAKDADEDDDCRISSSYANFLGLLLTPIVRPALTGSTPLCVIDAPKAGTGKTLLVDVFSLITTGRHASMLAWPHAEKEVQATIASSLLAGSTIMAFDNFEGILKSPNLALALTAREYSSRILGVSKMMTAANRATWVLNGNNVQPSGDIPRRCYHIRLDALSSQPYQGRVFRHANLIQWVERHRSELVHSLLVIARAWFALGDERPDVVEKPIGSFESWHRTIAGILHYAKVDGFLENMRAFREQDDLELQWEHFLETLYERCGTTSFTVFKLTDWMDGYEDLKQALPSSLADVADKGRKSELRRALGFALSKRKDVRYGSRNVRLVREKNAGHDKVAQWHVEIDPEA